MTDVTSSPKETPYSVPSSLLNPKSEARTQLLTQLRLLHQLHHRSKNQHGRSIWYRHFNYFRREVTALCIDLEIELGPGFAQLSQAEQAHANAKYKTRGTPKATSASSPLKPSAPRPIVARATARLQSWLTYSPSMSASLITQAYTSFTSLTTTPSFSPLALTLLAILARVCTITGLTAHLRQVGERIEAEEEDKHSAEIGQMLERFAKEDLGEVVGRNGANSTAKGPDADGDRDRDDVGVPMQRQPPADLEADQRKRKKAVEKPPTKKLRVIRKKEDSSIDDLFAGL